MAEIDTLPGSYEADLYGWAMRQAALLREGRLSEVEADHLAEQIEELGMSEYDKLESVLRVLILHMLKWDVQADRRSRSWALTIQEQRRRLDRHIAKNPSLKSRRDEAVEAAFGDARIAAARETDLPLADFPEHVAYSWDEIGSRPFVWDR
jgi:hypothetical protein